MVEGHSVHRVAARHRQFLLGRTFTATSPNCRFTAGAAAIDGLPYSRVEAVGKNLFSFFGTAPQPVVVVHVHFGMAGNWAIFRNSTTADVPEPRPTNRLRLVANRQDNNTTHGDGGDDEEDLVADLSAMTVQHGTIELYESKRRALGEDPLRDDANPESLWQRVSQSPRSIGALLMDQSFFCGPGNIYRAELLFKAGVHPNTPGNALTRTAFDQVWHHTVSLLQRGFTTGSILTVDPEEAKALGQPKLRRYIYNQSHCPRCQTRIVVWEINRRTCYACPTCQPKLATDMDTVDNVQSSPKKTTSGAVVTPERPCEPFLSHCAPDSLEERAKQPTRMTVAELRDALLSHGMDAKSLRGIKKVQLVTMYQTHVLETTTRRVLEDTSTILPGTTLIKQENEEEAKPSTKSSSLQASNEEDPSRYSMATLRQYLAEQYDVRNTKGMRKADLVALFREKSKGQLWVSSEEAALEKAMAGESLAVEHTAELAPSQARKVREQATDDNRRPKRSNRLVDTRSRKSSRRT